VHYSQEKNLTKKLTGPFPTSANWKVLPLNITESIVVEHVDVTFKATHPKRGNLRITLKSPWGTVSTLAEEHGDTGKDYDWTFGTIACWGENSIGTWELSVLDSHGSTGIINSFQLDIYGHKQISHG